MSFDRARKIADAVLFEGYILYPYRASAQKNQVRWQFGVLSPRGFSEATGSDPASAQTECLVEAEPSSQLHVRVRFLQVQSKRVEEVIDAGNDVYRPVGSLAVDAVEFVTWDEGVEQQIDQVVSLGQILDAEHVRPFELAEGFDVEALETSTGQVVGRIVRQRWPISGLVRIQMTQLDGPFGGIKLRIGVENVTPWDEERVNRDDAMRQSLVATHTLLAVTDGAFISSIDPPEWARPAVASCVNQHTWPVLIGEPGQRDVMLSSPIILYDYPEIASESPGDLFDATEIDEILTLRTMTLTDEEKREARGTDRRAAAIIDRVDALPPEMLDRLHGAVRYLRQATGQRDVEPPSTLWWNPAADATASPDTDHILVGNVRVSAGSLVRLWPGQRRADAQDMFLEGRCARVQAVYRDLEDRGYLAVTLADDPAADLQVAHGRFLYFYPDEVEPSESAE